jgi:hypothetical protein
MRCELHHDEFTFLWFLGEDMVRYVRQSVRVAMREYEKQMKADSKSVKRLKSRKCETLPECPPGHYFGPDRRMA